MAFKCDRCYLQYDHVQSLRRHVKAAHPSPTPKPTKASSSCLNCRVCSADFDTKIEFRNHVSSVHDFPVTEKTFNFGSVDEFTSWKTTVEQENCAFYTKIRGTQFNNKTQRTVFICNRSGHFSSEGKGVRRLKTSIKMGGYCPSEMILKVEPDGKCIVQFVETHWGHEQELSYVSPTSAKRATAKKIAAKVPVCSRSQITSNNALASAKARLLSSMKNFYAEIESCTSIEEIAAVQKLVDELLPTMLAVRESSGANSFKARDNSSKRKIDPQLEHFQSCKQSKTASSNRLSKPNTNQKVVIMSRLSQMKKKMTFPGIK